MRDREGDGDRAATNIERAWWGQGGRRPSRPLAGRMHCAAPSPQPSPPSLRANPLGCKRGLTRARRRPPPFFSYPTRHAGAVFIRCVVASLAHDDAVLDAGRIVDDGRVAQITGNAVFEGAVCKKKRR